MKRLLESSWEPLVPALPLDTPFVINVDPASVCNFRCQFCFQSSAAHVGFARKGMMSWERYEHIIAGIAEFPRRIKTLRLYAFGEPLLNRRFADMVRYAKDHDMCDRIDTTTNGSLLSPQLNRDLVAAGLDRINISVEGVTAEHYATFSKYRIDFDRYVDTIAHLYQHRGQCTVFIKMNGDVVSPEDQQRFLDLFTPIADGVAIEHVMGCWYDFTMDGVTTNTEVGVYGQPLTSVDVCPYIFYSYCINYDGEVSACFLDWNRQLVVGHMDDRSLVDIWKGEPLHSMRLTMLSKRRGTLPICCNCKQLVAGQPVNLDQDAEVLLCRYATVTP